MSRFFPLLIALIAASGDGPTDEPRRGDPFVDRLVSIQIGPGGGHNQDRLPDIVLGPPQGGGKLKAGRDVVSLGQGGSIELEFVDNEVYDGDGVDFIVFENPFLQQPGNDPSRGYFELAKVEVSQDGIHWTAFPFDTATREGCAGHRPVLANAEENQINPADPAQAGGDPFDLKTIGVQTVRFVRITDLNSSAGDNGTSGFDLDAVVAVYSRPR